jgi:hypothetical protein
MPFGPFAYACEQLYFDKSMPANPPNCPRYFTKKVPSLQIGRRFFQNLKRWLNPTGLYAADSARWHRGPHLGQSEVHFGDADGSGASARSMFSPPIAELSR